MMWAPIVNNVVACALLGVYAWQYGTSNSADGFTTGQEALLGAGATLGIIVQALVLVPYARAAGFSFRFRTDLRGVGLGHTLRLGAWTVAFVIANQIAYFVITRLATGSSTEAALTGGQANGVAAYQAAFLVAQVPHAVITVSLVTATMPLLSRLAADQRLADVRSEVVSTLRLVLAAVAPVATAVACLGGTMATVLFSHGALDGRTGDLGNTLVAFAPGLLLFTCHYLVLRGFYALEDTRTPFLMQLVVSGSMIAAAVALTYDAPTNQVATRLALAYGIAYLLGFAVSATVLGRRLGAGAVLDRGLAGFTLRLLLACAAAAAAMLLTAAGLYAAGLSSRSSTDSLVVLAAAGAVGAVVYLGAARVAHIAEVRSLVGVVTRR
jgi:putative peptidoglycan lipid II flippase